MTFLSSENVNPTHVIPLEIKLKVYTSIASWLFFSKQQKNASLLNTKRSKWKWELFDSILKIKISETPCVRPAEKWQKASMLSFVSVALSKEKKWTLLLDILTVRDCFLLEQDAVGSLPVWMIHEPTRTPGKKSSIFVNDTRSLWKENRGTNE